MKTVFYRIIDTRNAGDMACSPHKYFDAFKDCEERDIREWEPDVEQVSVFGGGGILYHELHDILNTAANHRGAQETGPIAIWGAGENMHNMKTLMEPGYLKRFDLVGLRDWDHALAEYVPCPTCMDEGFDAVREIKPVFPVVVYEHYDVPVMVKDWFPRMSNRHDGTSFRQRLAFLAQGEIVLTNTFHGAYWAQLLGRRVAIFQTPHQSSRFHHFKHQPPTLDANGLLYVHAAKAAPDDFHLECMNLNRAFAEKVMALKA